MLENPEPGASVEMVEDDNWKDSVRSSSCKMIGAEWRFKGVQRENLRKNAPTKKKKTTIRSPSNDLDPPTTKEGLKPTKRRSKKRRSTMK